MKSIYNILYQIENSKQKAVLCTIVNSKGSTPRKMGAKMIVWENGKIAGTIGGGALEKKVIEQALEVIKTQVGIKVNHNLVNELGMCCGGTIELFLEPIMNKKKLFIFGAGHVGKSLSNFANHLDFNVTVIDERTEAFEENNWEHCHIINQNHQEAISYLDFDEHTMVVVLTHDHAYDREIIALTAKKKNAYIGMIGSQRKVEIAKKNLQASNFLSKEELEKIDMPIGLNINAKTPEEIAISILAKLISVRNS